MSILTKGSFEFISHGDEQTRRLGMRLGTLIRPGLLICLQGDLGAGKTTFVQGLASGWGSLDQVSSPTFQLVNQYNKGKDSLYHLDMYRIANADEAQELDTDTMLEKGCVVIEWPEVMAHLLPAERIWIKIEHLDETKRVLTFTSTGIKESALMNEYHDQMMGK